MEVYGFLAVTFGGFGESPAGVAHLAYLVVFSDSFVDAEINGQLLIVVVFS